MSPLRLRAQTRTPPLVLGLALALALPVAARAQEDDPEAGETGSTTPAEDPGKPAPNTWGVADPALDPRAKGPPPPPARSGQRGRDQA